MTLNILSKIHILIQMVKECYLFTEATVLNVELVERNVAEDGGAAARRTREAP